MMMTLDPPQKTTVQEPPSPPAPVTPPPAPPPLRAFAALVWKDFRPNAPLLVVQWILAAASAVLIAYAAWLMSYLYNQIGINILLYPPFLTVAGVYFPLCGLLLGFVHGLADRRLDPWALLTHRPIPRTFHGPARITAGLLLYILGTGLPYAAAGLIATTRFAGTHGGFFVLPFLLPSLASFLLGFPCYLAALLATYWQLPWKTAWAKALPLCIPAIAAFGVYDLPAFSSVLLLLAGAALLLAITITAALATHAFRLTPPGWGRLALAATLIAGLALPLAWTRSILQSSLDIRIAAYLQNHHAPIHLPPEPAILFNPIRFDYHYTLLSDGTIAIQHDNPGGPTDPPTFTDLQGHPLPTPAAWPTSFHLSHQWDRTPPPQISYRNVALRTSPPLIQDDQIIYSFDGIDYYYDRATHAFLRSQKPDPSFFGFTSPSGELSQGFFPNANWPGMPRATYPPYLIATDRRLYLLSERDHAILREVPIDPPLTTAPADVVLLANPARVVLWHHMDHEWVIADTFDPDGRFLNSTQAGAEQAKEARLTEDNARAAWDQQRRAAATQPASVANLHTFTRAGAYAALTTGALDAFQGLAATTAQPLLSASPNAFPRSDLYPQNPAAYRLAWWLTTLPLLPLTFLLARRRRLPLSHALIYTLSPLLLGPAPLLPLLVLPLPSRST